MPRPNTLLFRLAKPSVSVTRSWANLGLSYLDCVASTRSEVLGILLSAWCLPARLILSKCQHVALKLFVDSKSIGIQHLDEINIHKHIENSSSKDHPGRNAIRLLLDSFNVNGPNGQEYQCLVHPPLWESILDIRHRNPVQKLPEPILAFVLKRLFQALDLLHTDCHVVHTDIKEANILFESDDTVLRAFEQEELDEPRPRKELDGRTIYLSRELRQPKVFGAPVLCDFGSTVRLDDGTEHREDIQPNVYWSPETILKIPWTYSVDVWNVGCMVSVNSFHKRPFTDPSFHRSRTPSKGSIYSPATIQNSKHIEAGPISLR
jgi:serine/threonine protein kinase